MTKLTKGKMNACRFILALRELNFYNIIDKSDGVEGIDGIECISDVSILFFILFIFEVFIVSFGVVPLCDVDVIYIDPFGAEFRFYGCRDFVSPKRI